MHVDAITRILDHYSKIAEECAKTIKAPGIQGTWGTDEKNRDKKQWIVAVMDLTVRLIPAWDMSGTKENHDAVPLLRTARDRAGKIPRFFITDCLDQYHVALQLLYGVTSDATSV